MTKQTIRVATRGSQLALTQTQQTVELLKQRNPEFGFEIFTVRTLGDKETVTPLSQFRGLGVFVKELEEYLLAGKADLAIHSLKDVPSEYAAGLALAGFPARVDPSDVLLTRTGCAFGDLPQGATVGTSSPRRAVQLRAARPDLRFAEIRGNLDTRIRKLSEGAYDAIVVAAAGMTRLGISFDKASVLPTDVCLPAIGQGVLAIECRADDETAANIARSVNDPATEKEVIAERLLMKRVGAGCKAPVAALARISGNNLSLDALAGDPVSGVVVRLRTSTTVDHSEAAAIALADRLADACRERGILIDSSTTGHSSPGKA